MGQVPVMWQASQPVHGSTFSSAAEKVVTSAPCVTRPLQQRRHTVPGFARHAARAAEYSDKFHVNISFWNGKPTGICGRPARPRSVPSAPEGSGLSYDYIYFICPVKGHRK